MMTDGSVSCLTKLGLEKQSDLFTTEYEVADDFYDVLYERRTQAEGLEVERHRECANSVGKPNRTRSPSISELRRRMGRLRRAVRNKSFTALSCKLRGAVVVCSEISECFRDLHLIMLNLNISNPHTSSTVISLNEIDNRQRK